MLQELFKLNSVIISLSREEDGLFKGGLSYLSHNLVTSTFPRWYVRKFMSFNRLNTSKPYLTISFDCDYRQDVEAYLYVINLLQQYNLKAGFAVVGKLVELYPEEHKLLVREGHEIMNHTYTHPNNPVFNPNMRFNELSYEEQKGEIQKCNEVCEDILNYKPVGFRPPHFLHTTSVYKILEELNCKYSSSTMATRTRSFGIPFEVGKILEFPLSPSPKYPFSCLVTWDIYRAPRKKYRNEEEFYELFKEIVQLGIKGNSYLNFFFDPSDVIKMSYFEKMLSMIKENFTVVTYRELVEQDALRRS